MCDYVGGLLGQSLIHRIPVVSTHGLQLLSATSTKNIDAAIELKVPELAEILIG